MGTNYVTIVKYRGREKVRQYGQTDGHPTSVIPEIIRFAQNSGNIEHLKRNLMKCRFAHHDHQVLPDGLFYSISDAEDRYTFRYFDHPVWLDTPQKQMDVLTDVLGFRGREVLKYILNSRRTRCGILDALILREADRAKSIYLVKARTTEVGHDGYFASYVINLDNGYVYCNWMGRKMKFSLSNPPSYVEIMMFEHQDEEDY